MIDLKALSLRYFYLFSTKNLDAIAKMFALGCQLRDWENAAVGKDDVVAVYEKIFNSVDSITATPGALYEDGDNIIAELLITINGAEQILVTDIITFNDDGKIISVRAYKG
jgi:hypothetical protein